MAGAPPPRRRPAFLPSRHGLAFRNTWPSQPALRLPAPLDGIGVGDAARGLCGGMVFAAADYFHAGGIPPATRPDPDDPLYRYLVWRLLASWRLPHGVARYYGWMVLPDLGPRRRLRGRPVRLLRGTAERTVETEWPQIAARLDRGVPVPLGLVTVESWSPARLPRNHQVLAYGYTVDADGAGVTVRVYDPNRGARDDVAIRVEPDGAAGPPRLTHNLGIGRPVRGFFRTSYRPAAPPR